MDLRARKNKFIMKLFKVEEEIFDKLEAQMYEFLTEDIDLKQYNQELKEANRRIDSGDFFTQWKVEKIASEWKLN